MADITLRPESLRALDALVHNFGIEEIVGGLAHICREKAEYARTALSDDLNANLWERDATTLTQAAAGLHKKGVPNNGGHG